MRTFTKNTHHFPEMQHPALRKKERDIFCYCGLFLMGVFIVSVYYLTNHYFN